MLIFRASLLNSYGKNTTEKSRNFGTTFYTSPNLRFHHVFWCFPSQSHSGAFTVKLSLKAITAHKKASLQNTVGRLIIILVSLFFLLIIRASILSPYGKNLPDLIHVRTKKMTNVQSSVTRLSFFKFTQFFCYFHHTDILELLLKKLLFNPITKKTMTNLQNIVKSPGIFVFRKCFAADHQSDILELLL